MGKLLIENNVGYHQEIVETVILDYYKLLNLDKSIPIEIFFHSTRPNSRIDFEKYIKGKYPEINFKKINNYDYYINCTVYQRDLDNGLKIDSNVNSNKKYIAHEITDKLKANPNIYFLTPLSGEKFIYADKLPFSDEKIKTDIPVYIIQGSLYKSRRNFNLLARILEKNYDYPFKIKLMGWGDIPEDLIKYKEKIILKTNLSFINFHKEFIDGYCILPLISKKTHPNYYLNKLTSTINYAKGYNLKCLIDKDLQEIYNLENVEVFNNIDDITDSFEKTLEDFYK